VLTGIDHLAIAVPDLDAAVAELADRVGIAAGGGGVHPGAGTANRLAWFGDTYLELIAVVDREAAAGSFLGEPTIRVLDEEGAGFVTFVLASEDLDGDVGRLRAAGSAMSDPFPGERRRPDGRIVRWRLARPGAVGPELPPFLIEHDTSAAEWTQAERAARATERHPIGGPVRLTELELRVADLDPVAAGYRRELGLDLERSVADGATAKARIGRQLVVLRARDVGAASRAKIRLTIPGARHASADLLGCRFEIRPG
jgi:Glyoxalase-like domain